VNSIFENKLAVAVTDFKIGSPNARVMVRATMHTEDFASSVTCGFDLTADGALKLAARLTEVASQLMAAEVTA
jgi:hypothetical protein